MCADGKGPGKLTEVTKEQTGPTGFSLKRMATTVFVRAGILPWFLLVSVVIFASASDTFLTTYNLMLVGRQATYLVLVAMGQMFALLTAGLDLSVGAVFAITSVITAMVMVEYLAIDPDAVWMAIAAGGLAGLATGTTIGIVNGIGISVFRVPPFIMTLSTASIILGIALKITSGVPIYGMPPEFSEVFGYGVLGGVAVPTFFAIGFICLIYVLLSQTRIGRYIYALGGNPKAALLSGINTKLYLFFAYVMCGGITAVSAVLMTARLESGEPNLGHAFPLESIAACVIGGVSLFGGIGGVPSVVLGAIFIILVQNGMHLMHIDSYTQMIVIGVLLILAVIADYHRRNLVKTMRTELKVSDD